MYKTITTNRGRVASAGFCPLHKFLSKKEVKMNILQTIAMIFGVFVVGMTIRNIFLMLRAIKQKDVKEAGIRIQKIFTGLATLLFAFLILCKYLGAVIPTLIGWGVLITSTLLPQKYFQWIAQKFVKQ